jgi:TonB family protein
MSRTHDYKRLCRNLRGSHSVLGRSRVSQTIYLCPSGYPNSCFRIYYKQMSVEPSQEIAQAEAVPRLLVELPSRPRVFFGNLRALFLPNPGPRLELQSLPAEFWPDVFVRRSLPWYGFLKSGACHLLAGALLIVLTHIFSLQPRVVPPRPFDRSEVIYYQAEELPHLDTRSESAARPAPADPELSKQSIISVPTEADNHTQTVVTPPKVKLQHDVALPNMVAWSDDEKRPQLEIQPPPLTPAAEITRMTRPLDSVVPPPPDLRASAAAPPRELQPALIAPPPSVEAARDRPLGDLNIGHSPVIAPAPQLSVAEQRARGSAIGSVGSQVVAPPPSLTSLASGGSFGSRGSVVALNLHPAVAAPPNPPSGNRRGTFAATPEGHPGASGSPGAAAGNGSNANGNSPTRKATSDLPAGLYVGKSANGPTSGVSGSGGSNNSVNPNLLASARPPRVSVPSSRPMPAESVANLSPAERAVFGDRRFYSVRLNMPNLNSSGGSWVIRFAERDPELKNANPPAEDISQPMATRKVDPAYPLQLMHENVHGTVILYAVIRSDGTVGNVRVLRGVDNRLDRYASEALAQWQFQPATKNGSPVDVEATFQIPFRPSRQGTEF